MKELHDDDSISTSGDRGVPHIYRSLHYQTKFKPMSRLTRILTSTFLMLSVGCNALQNAEQNKPAVVKDDSISPSPEVKVTPVDTPTSALRAPEPAGFSKPPEIVQNSSKLTPRADNPKYLQDYEPFAPIAATGKVTIRDNIKNINLNRLIAKCPSDSGPYAFAESTHYFVQICSAEYDPWLPKYYIGRAKDSKDSLEITNGNKDEARSLIFKNGEYIYAIYRDGRSPDRTNAYLEVTDPSGKTYAEALLYLYERTDRPH